MRHQSEPWNSQDSTPVPCSPHGSDDSRATTTIANSADADAQMDPEEGGGGDAGIGAGV
eukprot:CAMPEP_0195042598 /NCGR_PEP_ID=MMETSP0347-20130606/2879_1 /TAXON_ID=2932 /ORGANISM="Alexandrium fundyense, Strain CCMP1719" /LENGTH=58 /DNA_ID=CAMNT_0040069857 /DNA_START=220 /DNA_END=393 /DNA_ORIENTATION=+